jgi:hypothetical protein
LSDVYGQCLDLSSELVGAENSTGEPHYTNTEDQSSDGQLLDPIRIGQVRRKTVSTPEDRVHRPVSIVTILFTCVFSIRTALHFK